MLFAQVPVLYGPLDGIPHGRLVFGGYGVLDVLQVDAGFVGAEKRAVTIRNALARGVYQLNAYSPDSRDQSRDGRKLKWKAQFAVNGAPQESELAPLTVDEFKARQMGDRLRWVEPGETISLAGSQVRGQNWWMYLIVAVLLLLLVELLLLGWPVFWQKQEEAVQ